MTPALLLALVLAQDTSPRYVTINPHRGVANAVALSVNPGVCGDSSHALGFNGTTLTCQSVSGTGAPTDATYITQTANGTLSAEQALASLATGLVSNTTGTGVLSIYGGSACGANTVARSTNASGTLTCSAVDLASADVTGTLPASKGGTGLTTTTDDNVIVGNGSVYQSKAVPDCDDTGGNHLNYDTGTNAFSCGTSGGGGSTNCIYMVGWSWVAQVGTTTTTTECTATTNLGSVANRGNPFFVDMDRYTHAKIRYYGNLTGAQTGTVTVNLRDIGGAVDDITTSFNSGTSCVDHSSSTTDLSSKSGLVRYTLRLGDSTATDDPALSSIGVEFCTGSF